MTGRPPSASRARSRRPQDQATSGPIIPLASLTGAQRNIVTALIEAGRSADNKMAAAHVSAAAAVSEGQCHDRPTD